MPSTQSHLDQARRNVEFLSTIDRTRFPDWAIVVLFYVALHYIDAALASQMPPVHPDRHQSRDNAVASSTQLLSIYDEYRKLKTDSFNARYNPPFRGDSRMVGISETLYLGRIRTVVSTVVQIA